MPSLFKSLSGELHNRSLRELMRTVPPRQLVPFWGAIFFTFAIVGFSQDMFARGRFSLPLLALAVIGTGLLGVAVVYWEINQRRRRQPITLRVYSTGPSCGFGPA